MNEEPAEQPDAQPEKLPFLPRKKKFLIPVIILLALTLVGAVAGVLIGFAKTKQSAAFKTTLNELENHPSVRQHVGLPLDTGVIVWSNHDERNGVYDLQFSVSGPNGDAGVKSRCEREADTDLWTVTYLNIGVGKRGEGKVITLIGDPDNPPGSE